MFENDICRCCSEECPMYKKCYRGDGHTYKPGVYTVSNLMEVCTAENGFEMFIKGDKDNV